MILVASLATTCFATTDNFNLPPLDLRQGQIVTGNLFNVIIFPYDGKTVFYVVGKEAAELQWSKLQIKLIPSKQEESDGVILQREFGGFSYLGPVNLNETRLKISAPNIKSETIYLKGHP